MKIVNFKVTKDPITKWQWHAFKSNSHKIIIRQNLQEKEDCIIVSYSREILKFAFMRSYLNIWNLECHIRKQKWQPIIMQNKILLQTETGCADKYIAAKAKVVFTG